LLNHVGEDLVRVVELAPGEEAGVARDVCQYEIALLDLAPLSARRNGHRSMRVTVQAMPGPASDWFALCSTPRAPRNSPVPPVIAKTRRWALLERPARPEKLSLPGYVKISVP